MTEWTDLTRDEQHMALLMAVGSLCATMTPDELRAKAKRERKWIGGRDDIAALFAWMADGREALARVRAW